MIKDLLKNFRVPPLVLLYYYKKMIGPLPEAASEPPSELGPEGCINYSLLLLLSEGENAWPTEATFSIAI